MHDYLGETVKGIAVDKPVDSVENFAVPTGKSVLKAANGGGSADA